MYHIVTYNGYQLSAKTRPTKAIESKVVGIVKVHEHVDSSPPEGDGGLRLRVSGVLKCVFHCGIDLNGCDSDNKM